MEKGRCTGAHGTGSVNLKLYGGLGFRKMEEFNRALLAKQLWRLIRDPESLACRVLKARYFRHGIILDASVGSHPSYIWRSLLGSKEILARGLMWRVGDGKSINIFEANWIPSMTAKVGTTLVPWEHDNKVSNLINDGRWDVDLIRNSFNTYVAEEILKIPLPTNQRRDSLFWRFDGKGRYIVRDGYRLQMGLFDPPEHQSEYRMSHWWKFLWSLSLTPEVKIFWWSLSHDLIPANQNLRRHHIPVSGACSLCHFEYDTTCHSIFFCPAITHLWKDTEFYPIMKVAKDANTMDMLCWVHQEITKQKFECFAIRSWAIWKERQSLIHGNGDRSLAMGGRAMVDNVRWCDALLNDFHSIRKLDRIEVANLVIPENEWNPPRRSTLKLNVDASVNTTCNRFSVGGVLRNKQGRLLLAFEKQINQLLSVVHGELLAIKDGVLLLYGKHFQDVQIATNSKLAVQEVTAPLEDLSYIGDCASDLSTLLQEPMISEVIHVRRSANSLAHSIANFTSLHSSSFVWMNGEFPFWLVKLVSEDYSQ